MDERIGWFKLGERERERGEEMKKASNNVGERCALSWRARQVENEQLYNGDGGVSASRS